MTLKVSFLFVLFLFFFKGEDQIGSHVSSSSDTWNIPSACLILWHSLLYSSIVHRRSHPSVIRKKNLWKITGRIRLRCTAAATAAATTTQTLRLHSLSFTNVRYSTAGKDETILTQHNTKGIEPYPPRSARPLIYSILQVFLTTQLEYRVTDELLARISTFYIFSFRCARSRAHSLNALLISMNLKMQEIRKCQSARSDAHYSIQFDCCCVIQQQQ